MCIQSMLSTSYPDGTYPEVDLPYETCQSNKEYLVYEGSCYKITQFAQTYKTAKAECEGEGAVLASVGDAYDQAFIEMLMVYFNIQTAWIGLTREVSCLRRIHGP